jgi:DNA-binding transcriptional ArsR family regulator
METTHALQTLDALSHETRLAVFRLLVQAGPPGMPAGQIAAALDARQNTMSTHLKLLTATGLIERQREGRSIIYKAGYETARELILFLMDDCCAADPVVCVPVANSLTAKC